MSDREHYLKEMHNEAIKTDGSQDVGKNGTRELDPEARDEERLQRLQRTFWTPVEYPEKRLGFIWSRAGGIQEEAGRSPKQAAGLS
jgi:hypothetical protein